MGCEVYELLSVCVSMCVGGRWMIRGATIAGYAVLKHGKE